MYISLDLSWETSEWYKASHQSKQGAYAKDRLLRYADYGPNDNVWTYIGTEVLSNSAERSNHLRPIRIQSFGGSQAVARENLPRGQILGWMDTDEDEPAWRRWMVFKRGHRP